MFSACSRHILTSHSLPAYCNLARPLSSEKWSSGACGHLRPCRCPLPLLPGICPLGSASPRLGLPPCALAPRRPLCRLPFLSWGHSPVLFLRPRPIPFCLLLGADPILTHISPAGFCQRSSPCLLDPSQMSIVIVPLNLTCPRLPI